MPSKAAMRTKANLENTPPRVTPTTKASVAQFGARLVSVTNHIRAASRRRRARANGASRYAPDQIKPRRRTPAPQHERIDRATHAPTNSTMDVDMPEAKPAASSSVSLPRRLTKPAFKPINREAIRAADPELADTPTPYIQLRLAEHGNAMYKVLQSVEASAPERKEEMPKEVKIVVNDVKTAELPTHILGVYRNWALPGESNKRVDLYPAHHIMLAAHCSNLPPIPAPPAQSAPEEAPATITVPFLPICIPSPQTFPLLLTYIYTGREDALYSALLPMPVPSYPPTATTEEQARIDQEFSALLARSFPAAKLLEWAMRVNGLWRNTCTLGVDLDDLWTAIDLCWVLLLDAIAISTGGPRVSRF